MSNMYHLWFRSEHREIAAGVYYAVRHVEAAQGLKRAIDRKALGNSSEINPDIGVSETDALSGEQFDRIEGSRFGGNCRLVAEARQQPHGLQGRRDGDIEDAV